VHLGKYGILAQKNDSQERKLRLRWLIALSSIPLFGIITAFGIAPQTDVQNVSISTVVEELTLPEATTAAALTETQEPIWQTDLVRKGDTLGAVLERLNIRNDDAIKFLSYAPEARTLPSKLRPGRSITAQTTATGELLQLQYQYDPDTALLVKRADDGYHAETTGVDVEMRTLLRSAEIRSSLFAATDAADIPDSIAMQIANIFSSDIDFHQDLRKGDHFTVVYEAGFSDGEASTVGSGFREPGQALSGHSVSRP